MNDSDAARRTALLWTCASAVGAVLHAVGLAAAIADRAFVRAAGLDRDADINAASHVHNEATRLGVKTIWTVTGVLALAAGWPLPRWALRLVQTGLVVSVLLLDTTTFFEWRGRRAILRLAREAAGQT